MFCIKWTYAVVTFKALRVADGDKSRVPAAEFADLLWMGTIAASKVELEHAITTVVNMERARIIECVSWPMYARVSWGKFDLLSGSRFQHSGQICDRLMAHG